MRISDTPRRDRAQKASAGRSRRTEDLATMGVHEAPNLANGGVHEAPNTLLYLQGVAGNTAVQRLLQRTAQGSLVQLARGKRQALVTSDDYNAHNEMLEGEADADEELQEQQEEAIANAVLARALADQLSAADREFFERGPSLAEAEQRLRQMMERPANDKLRYEIGLIYNHSGLQKVLQGNAATASANATVKIPDEELEAAGGPGLVVSHNHPGGAPLSRGDVAMAVGKGLLEIRATGRYGTFVFKRTTATWGKMDPEAVAAAYGEGEGEWTAACPAADAHLLPIEVGMPDAGETFAKDNFMSKHYACRLLAERFAGIVAYEFPDEATLIDARKRLYEKRLKTGADKRAGTRTDVTRPRGSLSNEV